MKHVIIYVSNGLHNDLSITWFILDKPGAYILLSMTRFYDELKQENDHTIFASLKVIILFSNLFLFHIFIFAYFIVDN